MSIEKNYRKLHYIKTRKEVNLTKLLSEEIDLGGYLTALRSYLRQTKQLENGKELYPNIWLEIIDLKSLLKDEITSVNKLLNQKIDLRRKVTVDKNLRLRVIDEE